MHKYSLLTSYTHSIFDLLVTPPSLGKTIEAHKAELGVERPRYKTREEQRVLAQLDQEAWKKTLAQSVVHPGRTVEQDRDFIVQVLLRTKQVSLRGILRIVRLFTQFSSSDKLTLVFHRYQKLKPTKSHFSPLYRR